MPATPLFDAYVMVDWSAASAPTRGKDSIWIGHAVRSNGSLRIEVLTNPATRHEAADAITQILRQNLSRGRRTLIGWDFPLGYPAGTAAALGMKPPNWSGIWNLVAELIEDDAANRNNRFRIGAELNRRLSSGPFPFWGCPEREARPHLGTGKPTAHAEARFSERRLTELRAPRTQPVWKLAYSGSVGSQTLLGLPILRSLHRHFQGEACVWPFETGLAPPRHQCRIVFAEIYPSLVAVTPQKDEVKDEAQVRSIGMYFGTLDADGQLASLFAGDPDLTEKERALVEREEGWILGVTSALAHNPMRYPAGTASQRYTYLRDGDAIYCESFARIVREVDLSRLPAELHPLALRLVHAVGDPAILADLIWSKGAIAAGERALQGGAKILVDAKMVAAGVSERLLPTKNRVLCTLDDRRVAGLAKRLGTTRSAAAVELWRRHLEGAVVAIGNAPTALFHLLEMIGDGAPLPALVLGFPVGFVGAAEAKAALAENEMGIEFVALKGRRGGSALAAAAVNALAQGAQLP